MKICNYYTFIFETADNIMAIILIFTNDAIEHIV